MMLRQGSAHSANRWWKGLGADCGMIAEGRRVGVAFARPEVYEYLVPQDIGYAIRPPASEVLQKRIKHLFRQPVGRLPNKAIVRSCFSRQGVAVCQS